MYDFACFEYATDLIDYMNKLEIIKDNIISITVKQGYFYLVYKI